MGAVYKAADTRLGDRPVAVKEMIQSDLKSPQEIMEAAETFKHEALMLANLCDANLPRIYDHFKDDGHWYLVMDYIEGETLEEYLAFEVLSQEKHEYAGGWVYPLYPEVDGMASGTNNHLTAPAPRFSWMPWAWPLPWTRSMPRSG